MYTLSLSLSFSLSLSLYIYIVIVIVRIDPESVYIRKQREVQCICTSSERKYSCRIKMYPCHANNSERYLQVNNIKLLSFANDFLKLDEHEFLKCVNKFL
jgi:hypothetical protein